MTQRPHGLKGTVAAAGDSTPEVTDLQARRAGVATCAFALKTDAPRAVAAELLEALGLVSPASEDSEQVLRTCRWMRIEQPRDRAERPKLHLVDAAEPQQSLCGGVSRAASMWVAEPQDVYDRCRMCRSSMALRRVVVVA